MGNRLTITHQLHEAVSVALASGLCVDLEAAEGGKDALLTLHLHPGWGTTLARRRVAIQYRQRGRQGYFSEAEPGLCSGEFRTIHPLLEALAPKLDTWLREPLYEAVPEEHALSPAESWHLLLA